MNNNPIIYNDPTGHFANILGGALVGGLLAGACSAISQAKATGSVDWKEVGKSALVGAAVGAVAGATFGVGLAAGGYIAASTGIAAGTTAGTAAGIATVAASSVAAGQTARLTRNALTDNDLTEGLGNPGDMLFDATLGVVTFGLFNKGNFGAALGKQVITDFPDIELKTKIPPHNVPIDPESYNYSESPGPEWDWRGPEELGQWHKPGAKKESLRMHWADEGHGTHYDWKDFNENNWRIYPDGTIDPKSH